MESVVIIGLMLVCVVFLAASGSGKGNEPRRGHRNRPIRSGDRRVPPKVRINPSHRNGRREIRGRAHIIDGDTIVIGRIKLRLEGIDAPELDMPWGQKAKREMVDICKGQTITAKLTGETSFDRFVAVCHLPDGRDIGAELVRRGVALDLPFFSGGKYRHLEPAGARRRLASGTFDHQSGTAVQRA